MYNPVENTKTGSDTFSLVNKCVNCKHYRKKTRRTGECYRQQYGIVMYNTKKDTIIMVRPLVMSYYDCIHYERT